MWGCVLELGSLVASLFILVYSGDTNTVCNYFQPNPPHHSPSLQPPLLWPETIITIMQNSFFVVSALNTSGSGSGKGITLAPRRTSRAQSQLEGNFTPSTAPLYLRQTEGVWLCPNLSRQEGKPLAISVLINVCTCLYIMQQPMHSLTDQLG